MWSRFSFTVVWTGSRSQTQTGQGGPAARPADTSSCVSGSIDPHPRSSVLVRRTSPPQTRAGWGFSMQLVSLQTHCFAYETTEERISANSAHSTLPEMCLSPAQMAVIKVLLPSLEDFDLEQRSYLQTHAVLWHSAAKLRNLYEFSITRERPKLCNVCNVFAGLGCTMTSPNIYIPIFEAADPCDGRRLLSVLCYTLLCLFSSLCEN